MKTTSVFFAFLTIITSLFLARPSGAADSEKEAIQLFTVPVIAQVDFLNCSGAQAFAADCLDKQAGFFRNSVSLNGFESGGGHVAR